jgi:phospholipid/cholesterol/gamma-HCH transport system substrate-binding protein
VAGSQLTGPARLAKPALAAVVVALLVIAISGSGYAIIWGHTKSWGHHVSFTVPNAFEVIPGERVIAGGKTVGQITKAEVTPEGKAHLELGLDSTVWPLPTDSDFRLRMSGTIKRTDRFVQITPGKAHTVFGDHAQVPAAQFGVPVEYDELFNVFDRKTRNGLHSFFANGGPAIDNAAGPLHDALPVTPPVVNNGAAVFRDIGADTNALHTLVSSTAEVSDAVARSNPGVRELITGAANTFSALADRNRELVKIIHDAPQAFKIDGDMFAHGTTSVPRIAATAARLEPALTELDRLATPLNGALRELITIEPNAVDTFRTVGAAAPDLQNLLVSARTRLLPPLTSTAKQATTVLKCIRPYTPDAMAFLTGWANWMGTGFDNPHTTALHALVSLLPFPNQVPLTSAQMKQTFPDLGFEDIHPPGQGWDQPWYQPKCGATPAAQQAGNDPESGAYDASGSKSIPYDSK